MPYDFTKYTGSSHSAIFGSGKSIFIRKLRQVPHRNRIAILLQKSFQSIVMLRLLGRLMVLFPALDYSALSCGEWVTCLHFQRLHKYFA